MKMLVIQLIGLFHMAYNMAHMETDCFNLVNMINNLADSSTFISKLVSFRLRNDGLSGFSIVHIPRNRNLCVDYLAKKVRSSGIFFSYRSYPTEYSISSERL